MLGGPRLASLAPGRRQHREPRYPGSVPDLQTRAPARASTGAAGYLERDPGGSTNPATNYAWLIPRRRAHAATARAGMPGADPPAHPRHYWLGDVPAKNNFGLEISMKSAKQAIENREYVRRLLAQKQPGFAAWLEFAASLVETSLESTDGRTNPAMRGCGPRGLPADDSAAPGSPARQHRTGSPHAVQARLGPQGRRTRGDLQSASRCGRGPGPGRGRSEMHAGTSLT
jgi:hypothetical protein